MKLKAIMQYKYMIFKLLQTKIYSTLHTGLFLSFTIVLSTLLYGCRNPIAEQTEFADITIKIDPSAAIENSYSQLFSKIEYIPVPTDNNFLVGEVDKICITENHVILMDKYISRSIFIFDKKGKEKIRLHKEGRGPGEYVSLKDVYYDPKSECVVIHCGIRRKLLYYTLQGEFQQEQTIPFYTSRIFPLSDHYAFYCDNTFNQSLEKDGKSPNIILSTKEGRVLSSTNYISKNINKSVVYTSEPIFSECGNETLSIKPDHCNIIYHITADSLYASYKLDFGEYSIDDRYWRETQKEGATIEKVEAFCREKGLCESLRVLEDQDYIFFKYKYRGEVNSFFYSKKTGNTFNISMFRNDMDQMTVFYPKLLKDNKMYCLLSAEDIHIANDFIVQNELIPFDIIKNIKEFDNPLLVIFTIKDF